MNLEKKKEVEEAEQKILFVERRKKSIKIKIYKK